MTEHGWGDWPEDGPDFDADTADLGDGYDDGGFGADVPHDVPEVHDHGFDEPHFEDQPGDAPGAEHLPIGYGDAFGEDLLGGHGHGDLGPDAGPDAGPDTDHDGGPEAEHDAGPDEPAGTEGFGEAGDAPVGADPDLNPHGDDAGWQDSAFPEPLDLGAPEPVDGFPWTDPAALGGGDAVLPDPVAETATATPEAGDLFAYAGEDVPAGGANWAALAASPDPATSALARWWGPTG
jgi:hypothetical protein